MPGAGPRPKDLGTRRWATVGSRAWQGCPTEGPPCWNWHRLSASGSLGGRAYGEARPGLARSRKPALPAVPCPQSALPSLCLLRKWAPAAAWAWSAPLALQFSGAPQDTKSLSPILWGGRGPPPFSALFVCLAVAFAVEPQDAPLAHSLWGMLAPPIAEPPALPPSLPAE